MRVEDGRGGFAVQQFTLDVIDVAPATIEGHVFHDANGNGLYEPPSLPDSEDQPLAGCTVFLDQNGNGILDNDEPSAPTDADGRYELANLLPGTYRVTQLGRPDWTVTEPAEAVEVVVLVTGQTATADFANVPDPGGILVRAPQFTSVPASAAQVDRPYRYDAAVKNPDGQPLSFDLPVAPTGMQVNPQTGVVWWTPGVSQTGEHRVIFRVARTRAASTFRISPSRSCAPTVCPSSPPRRTVRPLRRYHTFTP